MKTQISTSVSEETRRKADALVAQAGYTYRELVSIGIDRLYTEWQERSTMSNETSAYDRAVARVNETPELEQYYDLLIEYDWPEGDEHYTWVATADVAELIDWAQTVRQDEDAD